VTFEKADLYATLMHEVKNHLGLLMMTLDNIPPNEEKEHDKAVDASRLLCQRIVDRLQQALLIHKAANGRIHPEIDAYSTEDLVKELRDTAESLCHGRLRIEVNIDEDVPAIWFFDRALIEMALINAVHNSIAYAKSTITVGAEVDADGIVFSVIDDSDGYPDRILRSIDVDAPHSKTGTGLGLQFAKMIAETHVNKGCSGALRLSNEPGAAFRMWLP